ncbi:hypothetical protein GGTG_00669 [Gaeumannomyces tritici R3-111a-1]|uniref:Prolyl 4-hydroxylase alpha subunit domain-containing protein n=1 Tax=Gaeumannomyces tritici (strain R3-111a-1) TaxID=644352 RepID=J3NHD2_GAET3|nr:hypothetical protein GGTG_00669 [Gaeumannomyces tritici R3-111a-1]EJT80675.1 hypothetical protein GGTG_00669 [Gaeumannomyces tritici R3-111a-1]
MWANKASNFFASRRGRGAEDDDDDDDVDSYGKDPIQPIYISNDVAIPDDFLSVSSPPPDALPITMKPIDFAQTPLPEYKGCYAVVLDNVLSPSECRQLLRMAEDSVPEAMRFAPKSEGKPRQSRQAAAPDEGDDDGDGDDGDDDGGGGSETKNPWRPALVHVGGGWEVRDKGYRNSDRIIWDQEEIVNRLWARLAQARGLKIVLANVTPNSRVLPASKAATRDLGVRWDFLRVNRRMRFLKYEPGGFFRPHCDGAYASQEDGKILRTWYTIHLYLNDSKAEAGDAAELEGGATCFLSSDGERKIDINPKAGRVLIFQHERLRHSGDDVEAGVKYTMRTDIEYQMRGLEAKPPVV